MRIEESEVQATAALAKLVLEGSMLSKISVQIQDLLNYADILADMAPSNAASELATENVSRQPQTPGLSQQEVLALAPDSRGGMIRIPRVMSND